MNSPPEARTETGESTWAAGILYGMIASAVTCVAGVEVLSRLGLVRQGPLLALGAGAAIVFALVLRARTRTLRPIRWSRPAHPFLLGSLLAIGGLTLLVALVSAPNSWDSMTYHMARVAEWFDHGSVEHYFTAIDRQLWQPPFGEYLVLLGYGGLGGRDYLANLPQWLAGLGAVLAVMETVRVLGAPPRTRYLLALFTATTPIIILQSTGTDTDLLGGFWVACAAWLALTEYLSPRFRVGNALWFGAALGLAVGTKGTSIPVGAPWALVFLLPALRPFKPRTAAVHAAAIGLMILAFNTGHFLRNYAVFGSPIGPETMQRMLRPVSIGPQSIASNLLVHLTLQLGTPWAGVNHALERVMAAIHSALGVDTAGLYPYFGGFRVLPWSVHEDLAGNPWQVVVGAVALLSLAVTWRRVPSPQRVAGLALLSGILLFALTVRWQPFVARLHTPMLILLPSSLLLVLDRTWPRFFRGALLGAALLALPPLLFNASRPLLPPPWLGVNYLDPRSVLVEPRAAQYFNNSLLRRQPYIDAIEALGKLGCSRVPLKAGYDSWEYPLWSLGRAYHLTFVQDQLAGPDTYCAEVGLDQPPGWRPAGGTREPAPRLSRPGIVIWR